MQLQLIFISDKKNKTSKCLICKTNHVAIEA